MSENVLLIEAVTLRSAFGSLSDARDAMQYGRFLEYVVGIYA